MNGRKTYARRSFFDLTFWLYPNSSKTASATSRARRRLKPLTLYQITSRASAAMGLSVASVIKASGMSTNLPLRSTWPRISARWKNRGANSPRSENKNVRSRPRPSLQNRNLKNNNQTPHGTRATSSPSGCTTRQSRHLTPIISPLRDRATQHSQQRSRQSRCSFPSVHSHSRPATETNSAPHSHATSPRREKQQPLFCKRASHPHAGNSRMQSALY